MKGSAIVVRQVAHPRIMALLTSVIFAVSPGHADDKFKRLGEKEIRARVVGKDITDGVHWSMYARSDGTLISMDMGKRRAGAWKIADGKLCLVKQANRPFDCYEVWMSRSQISLREDENDLGFVAMVEKHEE
jgi:hypothetical protein